MISMAAEYVSLELLVGLWIQPNGDKAVQKE
jgi:hypothetical protein